MKLKTCLAQVTQQKFANLKKINRLKLCETFDKPFKSVILWIGKFGNVSLCKFFQVLSKPTVIIFYEAIRIYKSSVDAWKIKKLTQNPLDKLISRVIRARNEPANSLLYTAHTVYARHFWDYQMFTRASSVQWPISRGNACRPERRMRPRTNPSVPHIPARRETAAPTVAISLPAGSPL